MVKIHVNIDKFVRVSLDLPEVMNATEFLGVVMKVKRMIPSSELVEGLIPVEKKLEDEALGSVQPQSKWIINKLKSPDARKFESKKRLKVDWQAAWVSAIERMKSGNKQQAQTIATMINHPDITWQRVVKKWNNMRKVKR